VKTARCVWPSVQIATGGGDIAVPQAGLNFGERSAAVDGVRAVGVAQPVRGNRLVDAKPWLPRA